MPRRSSPSLSGQERQEENLGHMHGGGGGTGGQTVMVVMKADQDLSDLSAIDWALTNVAGRGDRVIVLGVFNGIKKCCPGLPFRNTLGFMCYRVWVCLPNLHDVGKKMVDEQVLKAKEMYTRVYRNLQQTCKTRGVKLHLEIVPGHPLRQVAVQQALASKAEWVILDRHLKKSRHYFMKRLPCNLVLMTNNNQGSILALGPCWRLQKGSCSEACSADEKSSFATVSGLILSDLDRLASDNNTSEDSSDYTGSGDSDLSSHGGDQNQAAKFAESSKDSAVVYDLRTFRERLPPLVVGRKDGGGVSDDELFHSTSTSPQWSPGFGSPDQPSSSAAPICTRATIGGVLSLPLCSACKFKVPDFGPPKRISLDEIKEATNNFSNEYHLADCKLGTVFHGFLQDGQAISVKRLQVDPDTYPGDADFCSEIEILSLAHHVNVVTLIGFCIDEGERILVFEFACNKALSWHLSPLNSRNLSWSIRRKIALETARGLRYLHEECRAGSIVHGSMELNSVLLTHDYSPVICNFSQARLRPHLDKVPETGFTRATALGYLAPECRPSSSITTKSDVYSFGVMLLELINGGKATDPEVDPMASGELSVLDSIRRKLDMRAAYTLVDPELDGEYDEYELHCMIFAASQCIQTDSLLRPSMSKVLSILLGDQIDDEVDDQICIGGSSCNQVSAGSHFDMISAGVMVF
ncbi:hypothetical protein Mapa_000885 [Marchantia paleacea]|nr:hypothetical protein Mapa_000885 [Marchantia paleacea]